MVPGKDKTLAAGEGMVVPWPDTFETRNDGPGNAVVLAATLGMPNPATFGLATTPAAPPGVAVTILAGGWPTELPTGPATLGLGRVTLAAGAELPQHRVAAAELVAVEAGTLVATVRDGHAWLHPSGASLTAVRGAAEAAAGQGLRADAGAIIGYRNVGSDPLVLLVVTITEQEPATPTAAVTGDRSAGYDVPVLRPAR